MVILDRKQIEELIDLNTAGAAIKAAYVAASLGEVNLPPVGHIAFPDVSADCHIKYGHKAGDPYFVIKVATGFPQNAQAGLQTGNGVSLVLSAKTGAVQAVLHDEMVMTDIRTGLGGAIATRSLARADSKQVLVVGTGPQALRQIESHIALIGTHLTFQIWGRSAIRAQAIVEQVQDRCRITVATDLAGAVGQADVIVTVTGATQPVIKDAWVRAGTHITAVGADAPGKQELDVDLVSRADVLVADSMDQCLDHGELSHAHAANRISRPQILTIGQILSGARQGRSSDAQVSIADLTGIAAQDIAIAQVVLEANADAERR